MLFKEKVCVNIQPLKQLAVKTLGQLLRRKFSQHEWSEILETDMWQLLDGDNKINPVLRLSYHNLPSNRKRCFAYCSIFPKGYEFKKDELIRLWMAEGLLKCCGRDKREEELGNEIFSDLESISFFQISRWKTYFMHDLVNDLSKSVSGEFCKQIIDDMVEGSLERTRHIWFYLQSNFVDKLLEPICVLKQLRSLILNDYKRVSISNNVQHDLFSRLKCLRMLSFRQCGLSELVDEISNLKLLRYLDLSHTNITRLPDSICMLYNLQTLLLQGCSKLTELPSNFSELVNLSHLELPCDLFGGTCIKKMPKNIRNLNNLHGLTYFIVEEQNESNLKELEKLNHLHGTILIKGLGNVIDPADAATANLKDKKYLEELHMKFDGGREEMDESMAKSNVSVLEALQPNSNGRELDVCEALQPNSNLKRLTISEYKGNGFPNWITGCHLPNLVSIKLKHCGLCSYLPPLGQLPSLKEISISGCDGIGIIGKEFYGNNSTNVPFRSLEILGFDSMSDWEEWSCLEGFPLLKELCIGKCPKLKSTLPQHLPSLQKLEISDCSELEEWFCLEGFPLLKEISIWNCPKLRRALPEHLPSLQRLFINDCNKLEASIPKCDNMTELAIQRCDRILVNELLISLKRLTHWDNRYTEFSMEQSFNFPFLEELELDCSGSVKHPSLDLRCYNSLQRLSIKGWGSSSLPLELHLFTKLHYLYLYDCPELESFPMGGLPFNLWNLGIYNCPKLIGSREEWGLFQLNSLTKFLVSDYEFENVESFPKENLLPPTLHSLYLDNCSKLRIMNNKGFLHLKSLKELYIEDCPSLESLPEKEGGERWHTISHIPM